MHLFNYLLPVFGKEKNIRHSLDSHTSKFDSSFYQRKTRKDYDTLCCCHFYKFRSQFAIWVAIIKNSSLQSAMNYLLMSLNLPDIISGSSVYPYVFTLDVESISHEPTQQSRLCILTEGVCFSEFQVCHYSLCAISCNRFLGIY